MYLDTYEEIVDNYEGLDVDETFYYDEEKTKDEALEMYEIISIVENKGEDYGN